MKKLSRLLTIGLLSAWFVGCATPGRVYDDSKVALIKKDATTEAELVEWFGPASSRTMGPDGSKNVTWRFAPTKAGTAATSGRLEVRLGADGKVSAYTAASGTK
ncbi:MAG TPA: hypothetical protein VN578_11670 [Candidatus Binatia bacterium]|jgi:hypothetical protein|nr:hypothetical protein [Candidatus Binatia bacterium]